MAETPQQTWPPTGRVRFLGFTQDGEAMPTFQDLDYKGRQAIRTHEGSGLPDLTSPDVFRITQAAARRLYGESYEQQGRADAGAGLHPWLVDRVTAEAARERAEDSRVGGAARQHTEAVAALRRGDQGAWKRRPPRRRPMPTGWRGFSRTSRTRAASMLRQPSAWPTASICL